MSKLEAGLVLLDTHTDELLLLIKCLSREYYDDTAETLWDFLNLSTGQMKWEWEFVLEDERDFRIL